MDDNPAVMKDEAADVRTQPAIPPTRQVVPRPLLWMLGDGKSLSQWMIKEVIL